MGMNDIIAALFTANVMTLWFAWGLFQLHKKDMRAPWYAFVAVIAPMLFVAASVYLNEGLPPQFDALDSQQSAASHPSQPED